MRHHLQQSRQNKDRSLTLCQETKFKYKLKGKLWLVTLFFTHTFEVTCLMWSQTVLCFSKSVSSLDLVVSCCRSTAAQMPASWVGWLQPTVWVRWWPHRCLGCGLITGRAGSRWCAPSSSTWLPISTMPTRVCPKPITSTTCSCPEHLLASEQVGIRSSGSCFLQR